MMINFNLNRDIIKTIKTGDLLLFSSNKILSSVVKLFLTTKYNHVGIAIRIKNGKVVNKGGKLMVLESNNKYRYDELTKSYVKGVALIKFRKLLKDYDLITVRHLNEGIIPKNFKRRTTLFLQKTKSLIYSNSISSILGVWLGFPIGGIKRENNMFCSELVSYYYFEVLEELSIFIKPGKLCGPGDFMEGGYMDPFFKEKEEVVFRDQPNLVFTMATPFLLGLVLMILIYLIIS